MKLDITQHEKEIAEKVNYHADLSWAAMITDCTIKGFRWEDVSDNKKYRHAFNSGVIFGAEWSRRADGQEDEHINDESLNDFQKAAVTKLKKLWMVRIRPGQWQSVFGINAATCTALAKRGYGVFEETEFGCVTYGLHPSER